MFVDSHLLYRLQKLIAIIISFTVTDIYLLLIFRYSNPILTVKF